jgi:polyisoprenyl-teichoic acid--peptidoglycan teichoic acid transferase
VIPHPDEPRSGDTEEHSAESEGEGPAELDGGGEGEGAGSEGGLTEEFEAEFGEEFGAEVAEELDDSPDAEPDDAQPEDEPDRTGSLEVLSQETVEADVLALGDQEEAREEVERHAAEAAAALEAAGDVAAPGAEEEADVEVEHGAPEVDADEEPEAAADEEPEAAEDEEVEASGDEEVEAPVEGAVPAGEEEPEGPPKVGVWTRFLTASLVIVISMATATSVSLMLYLTDIAKGLGGIPNVQDQLEVVEGGDPQNILILGSDKRPDIKGDPGRSDTTMLLRLDPDNDAIALFSLPRDLKVNIPGYGIGKLNDAYLVGGPEKTLTVVKQLTGVNIHHVVNVDFKGFEQAINAIDCVYVDVDRRYFNNNEGLALQDYYSEIDIQAGYQMLCGDRALQYVRYRHTDNDIVRAARQQDFLREARQKIGPTRLFRDREELIKIFKKYTTSDIDSFGAMLDVLKTFLGAADAPVKQIHFQGTLGESYVTASNEQIQKAVEQFLGLQDTPGSLEDEGKGRGGGQKPKQKKPPQEPEDEIAPDLIDSAAAVEPFAQQFAPAVGFPVFYPTKLVPGSQVIGESREYKIADEDKRVHRAYKLVFSIPGAAVPLEFYGLMGTTWLDPPILENPTETREISGREYMLFYDGDRLRLVAWKTDKAAYWLNNTLAQTLEEDEMLAIADSMAEVAPPEPKKKKKKK